MCGMFYVFPLPVSPDFLWHTNFFCCWLMLQELRATSASVSACQIVYVRLQWGRAEICYQGRAVCLYFLTVLHLLQRWKQQHAQWYTFTSKYGNMHRVIILKLQSENANHILEQYNNRNKLSTKQNKKYKHETDEYLHELCLEFDSEESCKVYFQSLSGSVKWTAVGKAAKPSGSF